MAMGQFIIHTLRNDLPAGARWGPVYYMGVQHVSSAQFGFTALVDMVSLSSADKVERKSFKGEP